MSNFDELKNLAIEPNTSTFKSNSMVTSETRKIVQERLWLVKQLMKVKAAFGGEDLIEYPGKGWDHPYKHYHALITYLLLTCFDILGQPADWLTFDNWLSSKKEHHKEEKQQVFATAIVGAHLDEVQIIERVKAFYTHYNSIYGVKNSFYRFIKEVLSEENRSLLMSRIVVKEFVLPKGVKRDSDSTIYDGIAIVVDDKEKEKFLFNIRNSFTHKGISFGSPNGGLGPESDEEKEPLKYSQVTFHFRTQIFSEWKGNSHFTYHVEMWHSTLIYIIEAALQEQDQITR